jgi:hypothetical protein
MMYALEQAQETVPAIQVQNAVIRVEQAQAPVLMALVFAAYF